MKKVQSGFTLIELMIVIAIIGILAAVALPAYQDYTIRAKVSELLIAAENAKIAVTEVAQSNASLTGSGNNITIDTTQGRATGSTVSANGVITVSGDTTARSVGTNITVTFTPTQKADGGVLWACSVGGNTALYRFVPQECRK